MDTKKIEAYKKASLETRSEYIEKASKIKDDYKNFPNHDAWIYAINESLNKLTGFEKTIMASAFLLVNSPLKGKLSEHFKSNPLDMSIELALYTPSKEEQLCIKEYFQTQFNKEFRSTHKQNEEHSSEKLLKIILTYKDIEQRLNMLNDEKRSISLNLTEDNIGNMQESLLKDYKIAQDSKDTNKINKVIEVYAKTYIALSPKDSSTSSFNSILKTQSQKISQTSATNSKKFDFKYETILKNDFEYEMKISKNKEEIEKTIQIYQKLRNEGRFKTLVIDFEQEKDKALKNLDLEAQEQLNKKSLEKLHAEALKKINNKAKKSLIDQMKKALNNPNKEEKKHLNMEAQEPRTWFKKINDFIKKMRSFLSGTQKTNSNTSPKTSETNAPNILTPRSINSSITPSITPKNTHSHINIGRR